MSHHLSCNLIISECLNLPSLLIDGPQKDTLCNVIYQQILYGRYTLAQYSNEDKNTFVQYGFARHSGTETVIDEPLAVLAAMRWMDQMPEYSMFHRLYKDIKKHSDRRNGFEAYLAFYLRLVFKTAKKLDTVFTLREDFADLAWQREEFELVTVVNANSNKPQVSVVTPTSGPSSNVGHLAKSGKEVLQWITTNNCQFTICFPPSSFGPDLLFFLRHKESGKRLLVMVQAKNYGNVERSTLMEGIRTVSPSWFWRSKDMKVCSFL